MAEDTFALRFQEFCVKFAMLLDLPHDDRVALKLINHSENDILPGSISRRKNQSKSGIEALKSMHIMLVTLCDITAQNSEHMTFLLVQASQENIRLTILIDLNLDLQCLV